MPDWLHLTVDVFPTTSSWKQTRFIVIVIFPGKSYPMHWWLLTLPQLLVQGRPQLSSVLTYWPYSSGLTEATSNDPQCHSTPVFQPTHFLHISPAFPSLPLLHGFQLLHMPSTKHCCCPTKQPTQNMFFQELPEANICIKKMTGSTSSYEHLYLLILNRQSLN